VLGRPPGKPCSAPAMPWPCVEHAVPGPCVEHMHEVLSRPPGKPRLAPAMHRPRVGQAVHGLCVKHVHEVLGVPPDKPRSASAVHRPGAELTPEVLSRPPGEPHSAPAVHRPRVGHAVHGHAYRGVRGTAAVVPRLLRSRSQPLCPGNRPPTQSTSRRGGAKRIGRRRGPHSGCICARRAQARVSPQPRPPQSTRKWLVC
jgi:hypothetical protein